MATAAEVLHRILCWELMLTKIIFVKLNIADISEDLTIMASDREPLLGSNHPTLGGFVRYLIRQINLESHIHTLSCSEPWTP